MYIRYRILPKHRNDNDTAETDDLVEKSRRKFIRNTASLGAIGALSALGGCESYAKISGDHQSIIDRSISPSDPNFLKVRDSLVWQVAKPNRSPDYIVDAHSVDDVIAAVQYAHENKLKVIAKSGGHSIYASFLRDEGILINMIGMQRVVVNPEDKIVTIEPGVWGPILLDRLKEHGLAFPVARGASVALGGFLLGGGLGFNPNTWGLAYSSILAAEVVLADGTFVTVNEREHSDIYWAIRGAGPGFFGIVTKYYLRAHDLPATLMISQYIHPLSDSEKVGKSLESLVSSSDHRLEFILLLTSNPDKEAVENGDPEQVCIVNVVGYGDDEISARTLLEGVSKSALAREPLKKSEFQPTSLAVLTGETGEAFPRGRMATEGVWSDSIAPVISVLSDRVKNAVTPITTVSIRFIGNKVLHSNSAFSLIGTTNILSVLTWQDEQEDDVVANWLDDTMTSLQPYSLGHYINNEDVVNFPERNRRSFSPESWTKLRALKEKYDPSGLFHDYYGVG